MSKFVMLSMLLFTAVAAVLVVHVSAAAPGSFTPISIHKDRNYAKGIQPFHGLGHHFTGKLQPAKNGKEIYTGNLSRSANWHTLFSQVSMSVDKILVMRNIAIDSTIEALLSSGTIDRTLLDSTKVSIKNKAKDQPCQKAPELCLPLSTTIPSPHVFNNYKFEPAKVRPCDPKKKIDAKFSWDTCVVITSGDGMCSATANFSSTPDGTVFSLLFDNLFAEANETVSQNMFNCAFEVPVTVPLGMTITTLQSALRGYALSAPGGLVSIGWSAAIDLDKMPPDAWAEIFNTDSYDARVWENGTNSVDSGDFDPIMVGMQLDSMNPYFSPCGGDPRLPSQYGFYDVPVVFIFAMNAYQNPRVPHGFDYIALDSQDTQTHSIILNMPTAFEECDYPNY